VKKRRKLLRRFVRVLSRAELAELYAEVVREISERDGDEDVEETVVGLARAFFAARDGVA